MKPLRIIGVDPGYEGAIVSLVAGKIEAVWDMPVTQNQWNRTQLNYGKLAEIFGSFNPKEDLICVEKVHAMPKQGVVSMFNFGCQFGALQAYCAAFKLNCRLVDPKTWKSAAGLIGKPKEAALDLAKNVIFPDQAALFQLKKHIGRADAALIAIHGKNYPLP